MLIGERKRQVSNTIDLSLTKIGMKRNELEVKTLPSLLPAWLMPAPSAGQRAKPVSIVSVQVFSPVSFSVAIFVVGMLPVPELASV